MQLSGLGCPVCRLGRCLRIHHTLGIAFGLYYRFRWLHISTLLATPYKHRTGYRTPIRTGRGLTSLWGILGRSNWDRVEQQLYWGSCRVCTLLIHPVTYVSHVQHALWCTEANPNPRSPVPSSLLASACVLLVYINSERRFS